MKFKRNGRIYLAEVENKRDGSKVRQRMIRYIGVQSDQDKILFLKYFSELKIDGFRVFGSVVALDFIAYVAGYRSGAMLGYSYFNKRLKELC